MDGEVRRLAQRQRGNVTRRQLRDLGVSRGTILRALHSGAWQEPVRDVFFTGSGEIPPLARAQAALLAATPGSALSHETAAALHRIIETWPLEPHITSPDRNRRAADGLVLHRVRTLPAGHVVTRAGLRVTTPERTLLDLAEVLDAQRLARAVGEAEYRRLLDHDRLGRTMADARGRHGLKPLRDLLGDHGPQPTASHLEDRFYALLKAAELPLPDVNRRVGRYRPDFLWPEQRVIVETDGWAAHGGRLRHEADRVRDAELLVAGYRVMRVTARRLTRQPYAVMARLGALLLTPAT